MVRGVLLLALFAATIAAYLGVRENGFVSFDDPVYLTENEHVAEGLTAESARWAFTSTYAGNWHPLTWLSHLIDMDRYGLVLPGGHHLTSVVLHALTAVVLALALAIATRSFLPSFVVAVLFALHPQRVESVAWASERKDVLCGLFFASTLLAYAGYARRGGFLLYFTTLVAFVLALLSKSMSTTLPFLLLLLDVWPLRRKASLRRLLLEKVPFFALSAACAVVTFAAQERGGAMNLSESIDLPQRLANACLASIAYVGKFLWPADLAVFYPHPALVDPDFSAASPRVLGTALVLLAVSVAALRARQSRPYLFVGWFWFLGLLVPVIGIVQVGGQGLADRYSYLPAIGLAIGLVWSVRALLRALPTGRAHTPAVMVAAGATLAWTLLAVGATRRQVATWRSSETLYSHAILVTEENYAALNNLGVVYAERGWHAEAEDLYRRALVARPEHTDALANLGRLLQESDCLDEAEELYRQAIAIDSRAVSALGNLGVLHLERGETGTARDRFLDALAVDPDHVATLENLARLYEDASNYRSALPLREHLVALRPENSHAFFLLGLIQANLGLHDEADRSLERSLELDPFELDPYRLRAGWAEVQGRLDQAADHLERAAAVHPELASLRLELARLRGLMGNQDQAIAELRQALQETGMSEEERWNAQIELAWLLTTARDDALRDPEEAVELALDAVQATGAEDHSWMTVLAVAYSASGFRGKAVHWQERAVQAAPEDQKDAMITRLRRMETMPSRRQRSR